MVQWVCIRLWPHSTLVLLGRASFKATVVVFSGGHVPSKPKPPCVPIRLFVCYLLVLVSHSRRVLVGTLCKKRMEQHCGWSHVGIPTMKYCAILQRSAGLSLRRVYVQLNFLLLPSPQGQWHMSAF